MTAPAVTSILDLVAARLALIKTSNEYYTTPLKIERARMTPWQSYDLPAINYWPTSLTNNSNDENYDNDFRQFELYIEIHSLTMDRPFADVVAELAADVVVSLYRTAAAPKVSDAMSYNLGDKVQSVVFNGYEYEIGEGQQPWCGALLRFTIGYESEPDGMVSYS